MCVCVNERESNVMACVADAEARDYQVPRRSRECKDTRDGERCCIVVLLDRSLVYGYGCLGVWTGAAATAR